MRNAPVRMKLEIRTRSGKTASGEVYNRQTLETRSLLEQVERRLDLLGVDVELLLAHDTALADLAHDGALVPYGLDDVAGASLALGPDERGAF